MAEGTLADPIVVEDCAVSSPVKILEGSEYRSLVESLCSENSDTEIDSSICENGSPEELFLSSDEDVKPEKTERNSQGLPIFEHPPPKYSAHRIMEILLNPNMNKSLVAYGRPIQVEKSSTFVVDLTSLKHPDDVKKDMYGRWDYSGSHPEVFRCSFDQFDEVKIEKCAPGAAGSNVYYLRRIRSSHPSNGAFRRMIAFVHDHKNQPHQYCLAVYYLPQGFNPEVVPHGNCKSDLKPFYPTLPSTMEQMKEECSKGFGPKKVVSDVSTRLGGVLAASDSCEIPRNEQQVSKLKRRLKASEVPSSCYDPNDELAIVMHEALMENKSEQFIREVKCLREPAVIVATERQLNDLVRFCTVPGNFSILTIDPTFCLGDFDVTLITYRHRMLTSKQGNQHPAIIGPVMIHYKKTFSTYLFFASSLHGLRREVANVKCFGTDGEQALVDAFQHEFPNSAHLTCSLHVRRNTKAKLQELGIADHPKCIILSDLFGKKEGSHYTEGLVDSTSDTMYDAIFDTLVENWKKLDVSSSSLEKFVEWFNRYKSPVLKSSMLKSVRQRCGLGSPPIAFTTNASESVNAMLKRKVDYRCNELPQFLHHLKALIDEQEQEIQKAVVDRAKYALLPKYKKFKKSEDEWFLKMNESERVRHLQRFASFKLTSVHVLYADPKEECSSLSSDFQRDDIESYVHSNPESPTRPMSPHVPVSNGIPSTSFVSSFSRIYPEDPPSTKSVKRQLFMQSLASPMSPQMPMSNDVSRTSSASSFSHHYSEDPPSRKRVKPQLLSHQRLSVGVADFRDQVSIPEPVLDGVWKKASNLLASTNAIAKSPGSDEKAYSVVSSSGNSPHMVTLRKNGQYVCDKCCANWNSLRICSHTVAVAELNHDLPQFVSWLIKAKRRPSLTKLVVTNMPDGRGKKGGRSASHKKKKPQTVSRTPVTSLLPDTVDNVTPQLSVPSCPPPLVHVSPQGTYTSPLTTEPFELSFISGNISVCYGCRQKYTKPCGPPNDLCVKHKEWREYFPPGSATPQSRYGNCYYHCNIPCLQAKCPYFQANMLKIPPRVAMQLLPVHTEYLATNMGYNS